MNSIKAIITLATLGAAVAGCTVQDRTYYPRAQAAYPATTTYYGTPAPAPATVYYTPDAPSFQKSNVYSSRSDYYRNYQGIHDGPERTGW